MFGDELFGRFTTPIAEIAAQRKLPLLLTALPQYALPELKKLLNMICLSFLKAHAVSSLDETRRPPTISTQAMTTTVERRLPHSLCNDDIGNQHPVRPSTS
jgi:hypothetical protein